MPIIHSLDTLWVENFDEIALSRTVKEIQAILCFPIFGKNSKIQNVRHFWGGENFLKIDISTFLRYPVGRKYFDKIALSRTVKEIQAILCFAIFGKNSKIQNVRHFWGGENFLKIDISTFLRYPVGRKYFDKIALSRTVKEIQAILCFAIFGKNSKIQNVRHFWGGENFLKIDISTFLRYPVGRKYFDKIALSRTVKEIQAILCFAIFGKNSKIQNGRHFWGGEHV